MSLRITQSMLFLRAIQDIRKSSRGIIKVQEQVASGRRINRPSDDPAAMLRLLPLNSELANFKQLKENTELAKETLNTGSVALEESSAAMARLKELLVQAANGTVSPNDRKNLGLEVDQLMQHMVGIANSRSGNSYLFSGTRTETAPFSLTTDSGGSRVSYQGSSQNHEINVAPGIRTTLYSAGDRFFRGIDRSTTVLSSNTGAAATTSKDTGRGFGDLDVTFNSVAAATLPTGVTVGTSTPNSTAVGVLSYTIATASLPATMSVEGGPSVPLPVTNGAFQTSSGDTIFLDVSAAAVAGSGTITAQADLSIDGGKTRSFVDFSQNQVTVTDSYDGSILNVNVANMDRTGSDDVTYTGTFDVFTVMIAARDVMKNAAGLSADAVQGKLQQLIGEVTTAHDNVLTGLQELGIRTSNLELLQTRMEGLIVSDESTRSNIQDADLAESISEMSQKQFNFQASLQVSARIIQTTLLNFLR